MRLKTCSRTVWGRDERGVAAVELAIFLPVLVLAALAASFTVRLVLDYSHVNHLAEAGARYATRAAPGPANQGVYRLTPTAAEVQAYVRGLAEVPVESVEVVPDPTAAFPGAEITVTVHARRDLGVAGSTANGVVGVAGGGPLFPDGGVGITSTAVMRKE